MTVGTINIYNDRSSQPTGADVAYRWDILITRWRQELWNTALRTITQDDIAMIFATRRPMSFGKKMESGRCILMGFGVGIRLEAGQGDDVEEVEGLGE